MSPRVTLILQILSLVGVPTLILCGYRWIKRQIEDNNAVEKGMQVLLSDRITQIYYESITKGYCRMYVRKCVDNLYEQYKALGGNGHIEDLHNKILVLPTGPQKEEGE